ncbi:hypothetical protein E2C01_047803 [Portunus trituberculatus]|uniref:Uncharacterized protein n=1 Tax=Portunus trituberculatus TaxID=210409 RepID=A0A5B7G1I7_PORTR|nr:hypothetical protein [Portunus trituberculatus]
MELGCKGDWEITEGELDRHEEHVGSGILQREERKGHGRKKGKQKSFKDLAKEDMLIMGVTTAEAELMAEGE